jgi:hypothetical protein
MKSLTEALKKKNMNHRPVNLTSVAQSFGLRKPFSLKVLIEKLEFVRPPPPPPPPPPQNPSITVTKQGSNYLVKGSGFKPNKAVRIRVQDTNTLKYYFTNVALNWPTVTSDGDGRIDTSFTLPVSCIGTNINVSATDNTVGPEGREIFSNIVTIPCG